MAKILLDEWLVRWEKSHGGRYDYSEVEYINSDTKVKILCSKHGEFWQTPRQHETARVGCRSCGIEQNANKRQTLSNQTDISKFIEKAHVAHNNKYDYSLLKPAAGKQSIMCPKHGIFEMEPHRHLNGHGCQLCGYKEGGMKSRKDQEYFLKRSHDVHGDRYDYSQSVYSKAKTKLKVICSKHGEFWVSPDNHYKGKGCRKCFPEELRELKRRSEEEVFKLIGDVHGDTYKYKGYVGGEYVNGNTKLIAECKEHGEFQQSIQTHVTGAGCPVCSRAKSNKYRGKEEYCERHKTTNMYLMEIKVAEEHYLKVGISINPYSRAVDIMKSINSTEVQVLSAVPIESNRAWELEWTLHNSKILTKYSPNRWFSGGTECYSLEEKERLCRIFNNLEDKFGGYNDEEFRPSAD